MDFLSNIVSKITELKYGVINDIADNIEEFVMDVEFIDEGIVESKVEHLRNKLRSISSVREKKEIYNKIVFLLSNLEKYLDDNYESLLVYLDKCNADLAELVDILHKYYVNEKKDILSEFSEIEEDIINLKNHFLFHKIKGILLVEEEEYFEAIGYFKQALKLVPEDLECYRYLSECYHNTLHEEEKELINQMIELLEGKNKEVFEECNYEEE